VLGVTAVSASRVSVVKFNNAEATLFIMISDLGLFIR